MCILKACLHLTSLTRQQFNSQTVKQLLQSTRERNDFYGGLKLLVIRHTASKSLSQMTKYKFQTSKLPYQVCLKITNNTNLIRPLTKISHLRGLMTYSVTNA